MAGQKEGKRSQEDFSLLHYFQNNLENLLQTALNPRHECSKLPLATPDPTVAESSRVTNSPSHLKIRQNNPQDCSNLIIASVDRATVEISRTIIALNATFSQQMQQASISASNGIRSAEQSATQTISVVVSSASSVTSVAFSSLTLARFQVSNANLALTSAAASASSDVSRLSSSLSLLQARVESIQSSASSANAAASPGSPQIISVGSPDKVTSGFALTPAQGAGIIIGVVILSMLSTVAVYFLVVRFKEKIGPRERDSYLDEKSVAESPRKVTGRSSSMARTGNEMVIKFDPPINSKRWSSRPSRVAHPEPHEVVNKSIPQKEVNRPAGVAESIYGGLSPVPTVFSSTSRERMIPIRRSASVDSDFGLPVVSQTFPEQRYERVVHAVLTKSRRIPRIQDVNRARPTSIAARRMRKQVKSSIARDKKAEKSSHETPDAESIKDSVRPPGLREIVSEKEKPNPEYFQSDSQAQISTTKYLDEDPFEEAIKGTEIEEFNLDNDRDPRDQPHDRLEVEGEQEHLFSEEDKISEAMSTIEKGVPEDPLTEVVSQVESSFEQSHVDSSIKPIIDDRNSIRVSTTIDISISERAQEEPNASAGMIPEPLETPAPEILSFVWKEKSPRNSAVAEIDQVVPVAGQDKGVLAHGPLSWNNIRVLGPEVKEASAQPGETSSPEAIDEDEQAASKSRTHERLMAEERERTLSPLRRNPITRTPIVEAIHEVLPSIKKPKETPPPTVPVEEEMGMSQVPRNSWIRNIASLLSKPESTKVDECEDANERQQRGRSMIRTSDIIEARKSWRSGLTEEARIEEREGHRKEPSLIEVETGATPPRDNTLSPLRRNPISLSRIPTPSVPPPPPTILRSPPLKTTIPPNSPPIVPQPLRKPSSISSSEFQVKTLPIFENASRIPRTAQFSSVLSKFQNLATANPIDVAAATSEVNSRARAGIYIPGSLREQAVRTLSRSRDRAGVGMGMGVALRSASQPAGRRG